MRNIRKLMVSFEYLFIYSPSSTAYYLSFLSKLEESSLLFPNLSIPYATFKYRNNLAENLTKKKNLKTQTKEAD